MSSLLNIGASGLLAQSSQLHAIGNNIANTSTTGYKAASVGFAESFYLASSREANGTLNQRGQGVQTAGVQSNWSTGAARETGIATNIAIQGNGFLPVLHGGETMYTRNGGFAWTDYGLLSAGAMDGFVLALPSGAVLQDINQEVLRFDAVPTSMAIAANGTITVSGATLVAGTNALGLRVFSNPDGLLRTEGGLFGACPEASPLAAAPVTPGTLGCGTLRQGHLEMSNVDLVNEFTSLISAQRAFQANSRTVTTADELLQEVMNLKR